MILSPPRTTVTLQFRERRPSPFAEWAPVAERAPSLDAAPPPAEPPFAEHVVAAVSEAPQVGDRVGFGVLGGATYRVVERGVQYDERTRADDGGQWRELAVWVEVVVEREGGGPTPVRAEGARAEGARAEGTRWIDP